MWIRICLVVMILTVLPACGAFERPDLKSPCAGTDGSPCGPKRAVNDWWMS